MKTAFQMIEEKVVGKTIKVGDKTLTIDSLSDFVDREVAVGIRHAYAVVESGSDTYVIFENGEIQDDSGKIVGESDLLEYHEP